MSMVAQEQRQPTVIANVTQLLTANMKAISSCLPKHMTPERMCRVAVQTISRNRQLQQCTAASLVAAIIEASTLGLELDVRGQAYLVPYKNTVTLIPGYKGLMDLAYRSGRVANIYAETVCDNDDFKFELGMYPKLEHRPNLDDRGKLRAVYAVAKLKDADPVFVVMGRGDVEKVKRSSQAATKGPWKDWEDEMWKKTAIRRLCKYLPLSPEMQRAISIDEAADAGVAQNLAESVIDIPQDQPAETDTAQLNDALKTQTIDVESVQESQPTPATPQRISCPKINNAMRDAEDCLDCAERDGCPAW